MDAKFLLVGALLLAGCKQGTEEDIAVRRLDNRRLVVSCEDEREPVLHKQVRDTEVVVTCEGEANGQK